MKRSLLRLLIVVVILTLVLSLNGKTAVAQQINLPAAQTLTPPPPPDPIIEFTGTSDAPEIIVTKPPYPYYFYDINYQPINLLSSSDVIVVDSNQDCLLAKENLLKTFSEKKITILKNDVYEESAFSLLYLSQELSTGTQKDVIQNLNQQYQRNCVSPVFTWEDESYFFALDEFMVKFKVQVTAEEIQDLIADYELETMDEDLGGLRLHLFRTTNSKHGNVYEISNYLVENGLAEYAHPNFHHLSFRDETIPVNEITDPNLESDPKAFQWNLEKINTAGAWNLLSQAGVPPYSVKVAVIDTGVQRSHEDLTPSIGPVGYDAVNDVAGYNAGEPRNCYHGTFVSGVIAATPNNGLGGNGVGYNYVQIVPIQFGIGDGCEINELEDDDLIRAITWATDYGVNVINLSAGVSFVVGVTDAIYYATHANIVFVAGSGNSNESVVAYPARDPAAIAVGATVHDDTRKSCEICSGGGNYNWGSNYGDALGISAPGHLIYSTDLMGDQGSSPNNYNVLSGTSFSAPEVAAVAAMMLAVNPSLTPIQVQDILQRTADEVGGYSYSERLDEGGWNENLGFGRLNAYEAVRAAYNAIPKVSFQIQLQNVSNGQNHAVNVAIGVFGKYLLHPLLAEGFVATDASGHSVSDLQLPGMATGNYMVCAKPEHYLWRCLPATLTNGTTTYIDFSSGGSYSFYAGDFGINGEDGFINSTDFELFRAGTSVCFHQPAVGFCAKYDLRRDGQINTFDDNLLRVNNGRYSDGFMEYGGWNWRPFNTTITQTGNQQDSPLDASTTTGSVWMESSIGTPFVGLNFDVHVMMDLSNLSLGAGSSNLILHYDPGVLQVVDAYPAYDGIQITPGTLFESFNFGTVDPVNGDILFGALQNIDLTDTSGVNTSGELAMITFQPVSAISSTEITPLFISDESLDSNASEFTTGYDVLTSVEPLQFGISGSPSRVMPTLAATVPQGSFINTYSVPVSVNVNDPYNQVQSVQVQAWYDNAWHYISTDDESMDGWSVVWDTSGISDQVIYLTAFGFLPGGLYGTSTTAGIKLDRTAPNYISHSFNPPATTWPDLVEVGIAADDNLSGVSSIEMYMNDAPDGSEDGNWVFVDQLSGDSGTFTWDTSALEEGQYLVAFAIQDAAGNWNRWEDPDLPRIVYGQKQVFLPAIMRLNNNTGQWVDILHEDFESVFPRYYWVVYDLANGGTGIGYQWDDRSCLSSAGGWSGWAVGGGDNGGALSCGSNYPNNVNTWMVYGPLNLSDATNAELLFDLWLNSEAGYDYVYWGASDNGSSFSMVSESGNTNGWVPRSVNLGNINGNNYLGKPQVWIAFLFTSDNSISYQYGAVIDEIVLKKCTGGTCQ